MTDTPPWRSRASGAPRTYAPRSARTGGLALIAALAACAADRGASGEGPDAGPQLDAAGALDLGWASDGSTERCDDFPSFRCPDDAGVPYDAGPPGAHGHACDPTPGSFLRENPIGYFDPTAGDPGGPIYEEHCARCHGSDGHGEGPEAREHCPRPEDLHLANRLHVDPYLLWRIERGGMIPELDRPTAMPAFAEELDEHEIWLVITYIRWHFVDFL